MDKEVWQTLGLIVFFLIYPWIKPWLDERKKRREDEIKKKDEALQKEKSSYPFVLLVDAKVKIQLHILMQMDRPYRMFVFHLFNGEVTLAKLHLYKVAILHEIVQGGHVRYMTQHFQRQQMDMLNNSLKITFEKGYHADNYEDLKDNPPFQEWMDAWDFKSVLFIAIKAPGGTPTSCLVMQWPGPLPIQRNDILRIVNSDAKKNIEKIYEAQTLKELHYVDYH